MNTLIQKFSDVINGYISGFDRIVFKGSIQTLMHERVPPVSADSGVY